jgi:phosphohistidine phosphatase SixA
MRRIGLSELIAFALVMLLSAHPVVAQTPNGPALILLVRHAEAVELPDDPDPGLTDVGKKRAQDLAATLRDAGVSTILVSPLRRTGDTAAPLAALLGLKATVTPLGRSIEAHVAATATAARRATGVVLVVGHSNTIPEIIAQLGGPKLPDICDPVHDDLFSLLTVDGKVRFVRARYGEQTKPDTNCPLN